MKKSKDTDYLFLSSYLHAKEGRSSGEAKITLYRELESLVPDPSIPDFFRLKYDYHNAKVLLKSSAMREDHSKLYSPLGRYPIEKLERLLRDGRENSLPAAFSAAFTEAADTLARTADPRLADFRLDAAYLRELTETAGRSESPLLTKYAVLCVDMANLTALARMLKSGVDAALLPEVLAGGGTVSPAAVQKVYPDVTQVFSLYSRSGFAAVLPLAEQAARGEIGCSALERQCRAAVDSVMTAVIPEGFGENVLIRYLYRMEEQKS